MGVGEMFGHHVRSKCEIGRTYSKFGRTMSGDRLLFPALHLSAKQTNAQTQASQPNKQMVESAGRRLLPK